MLYLLAIIFPPLAIGLSGGRWILAAFALLLCVTVLGWIPAAIWAVLVVNEHKADRRAARA